MSMNRALSALKGRVMLLVARGILRGVNDGAGRQFIQSSMLAGETRDKVERVQQYGFTSHPLGGAAVIVLCQSGNRDHPLAIAVDDPRVRKHGLQPGEVAIYNDKGDYILMRQDRTIEINCEQLLIKASEKVRVETPEFEVTGTIMDRCDSDGMTMNGMRDVYNTHVHPENDSGGPTDDPNQKMEGGA